MNITSKLLIFYCSHFFNLILAPLILRVVVVVLLLLLLLKCYIFFSFIKQSHIVLYSSCTTTMTTIKTIYMNKFSFPESYVYNTCVIYCVSILQQCNFSIKLHLHPSSKYKYSLVKSCCFSSSFKRIFVRYSQKFVCRFYGIIFFGF